MSTEADVYSRQDFGKRMGAGKSPALLLIDFTVGFVDPAIFGGGNIEPAAQRTRPVLEAARRAGIPVAFTKIVYAEDGSDAGVHALKVPRLLTLTDSNPASDFVDYLMPQKGEIVIRKRLPSAFFATELAPLLCSRGVDTIYVAGCTTSGCVRASVLDGMSHGFRMLVMGDCVGDRAEGPHASNLFDMRQKYADIITADEFLASVAAVGFGRTGAAA